MWRLRTLFRLRADYLTLEARVRRAGLALACAYSSSDEYESEVIAAQRAAGVYGPKRHQRALVCTGLAAAALLVIVFII
jgi:hypothetical protein